MTQQTEPTSERLVKALEALEDPRLAKIIQRARESYYDEFKGNLVAPLNQLVADIRQASGIQHQDFVNRIMAGDFDATREESAEWFRREGADLLMEGLPRQSKKKGKGFGKR